MIVFAWATGRIDPAGGVARTFAFVKEKAGGKSRGADGEPAVAPDVGKLAAATGKLDNQTLCLAHAVYYEAGGDQRDVQVAIAQVVINRTVTPKGTTDMRAICRVVYRGLGRPLGCLFRSTCQNIGTLPADPARWVQAIEVAKDVVSGRAELPPLIQHASHFHAVGPRPAWTSSVYRLTRVGRMVFYSPAPIETATAPQVEGASAGKLAGPAAARMMPDAAGMPANAKLNAPRTSATTEQRPREKAAKAEPQRSPFGDAFH